MKILINSKILSTYLKNIINTIALLPDIKVFVWNKDQPKNIVQIINEVDPDIFIVLEEDYSAELKAYRDKSNKKVIIFGSEDNNINCDATLKDKNIINSALIKNSEPKEYLKSKISVFTDDKSNAFLVNLLDKNYKVKIFGSLRVETPKYLGNINDEQGMNIVQSSDIIIDLTDSQQYMLAATYLNKPGIWFPDNCNIILLLDMMNKAIEQPQRLPRGHVETSLDESINLLNKLGYKKESQNLREIFE